ncbi:MAG: hypothetical protein H7343_13940 [Undibacterium sp.]|nr:hypothetical protein [Opitutaceae bacterium]
MMAEAFRRLELGWPLSSYRYVGMGSVYFADFQLFHQSLGIHEMVSIEREKQYETRFEFNRPFRCVQIEFGESSDVLNAITWDKRSIVWLDYDGQLDASVIADLQTVVQKAASGSMIVVSVNAESDRPPADVTDPEIKDKWRLAEFEARVGAMSVPAGLKGDELRGKLLAGVCWRVLTAKVSEQLAKRNGRPDVRSDTAFADQVFHFRYADGASMLTVGWLIYSHEDQHLAQRCNMKGSVFRDGNTSLSIEAPKLTPKEIRHLNAELPDGPPVAADTLVRVREKTGIMEADLNKFASVYRYYPQYGEIVL